MSGFVLINIESGHLSIHYSVPDDGRGRGVEGLHQGDAGSRILSDTFWFLPGTDSYMQFTYLYMFKQFRSIFYHWFW